MFLPNLTPSKKVFSQLYCTLCISKWVVDVPFGHVHIFRSLSIVVGTHPVPPDSPDALWNNEMYGQIFTFELYMTNRSHKLLLTLYKYFKKVLGQYKRYLSWSTHTIRLKWLKFWMVYWPTSYWCIIMCLDQLDEVFFFLGYSWDHLLVIKVLSPHLQTL